MTPKVHPRYLIIREAKLLMLAASVDQALQEGVWSVAGGPFFDGARAEWCQAIHRLDREGSTPSPVKKRTS